MLDTSIDCCGQNGAVHLIFFSISADHLFHRRSGGGGKMVWPPQNSLRPPSVIRRCILSDSAPDPAESIFNISPESLRRMVGKESKNVVV